MNDNTSVEQTQATSEADGAIDPRVVLKIVIFVLLLVPAALFIPAGRWDWGTGWVFVGLYVLTSVVSRVIVMRQDPELAAERVRSTKRDREGVKGWDKLLSPLVALYGPLVIWIVAGLDERYGWSPQISPWVQVAAIAVAVLGSALATWAMLSNTFFSGTVRIQEERGHTVASGGPYRYVRHPGYAAGILFDVATPLILGSLWALVPAGLTVCAFVVRTALEDRTLQEELAGYEEYAQQTRYRLMPGVW
ncbi:MAG: isoprenylcysteine carboxylmethyltransferase family protein [Chloroflexi bacterium]|nr:isoprenylcysteine carboxylmethyltransferase family protein [Chloroflexota bacterium]